MEKCYKIITDQAGVVELANYIKNGNIISYDTETTSVNPRTGQIIGFSVSANIGEGYYFPARAWSNEKQELEEEGLTDIYDKFIYNKTLTSTEATHLLDLLTDVKSKL